MPYSVYDLAYSVYDYSERFAVKMKKALIFRVLVGIKKTETPINQGISAVLPKLYLGGGNNRARRCSLTLCPVRATIVIGFADEGSRPITRFYTTKKTSKAQK